MNLDKEIYNIISDVFKTPIDEIKDEYSAGDIREWDSLGQIILTVALENKFKFKFTIEEMFMIITVRSIIDLVEKKVNHNV